VLLAEGCNISLTEVAHPGLPALSHDRLSWVSQNYVRAETIAAANERLLAVYRRIPLVQILGDGHIATVDGMRFRQLAAEDQRCGLEAVLTIAGVAPGH
jgi:TnpA family transposase